MPPYISYDFYHLGGQLVINTDVGLWDKFKIEYVYYCPSKDIIFVKSSTNRMFMIGPNGTLDSFFTDCYYNKDTNIIEKNNEVFRVQCTTKIQNRTYYI